MEVKHLDKNGVEFDINQIKLPDELWEQVAKTWNLESEVEHEQAS